MKRKLFFTGLLFLVAAGMSFWSCQKDELLQNAELKVAVIDDECEPYMEYEILAGQHTNVGKLVVSNDETTLTIEYVFNDPALVKEVHLWVGTEPYPEDIPFGPGQFPYKDDVAPIQTKWEIPLASIFGDEADPCNVQVYILAHAALTNGETAWSKGPATGNNWSMYSLYTICCNPPTQNPGCEWIGETAWGAGKRYVTRGNWATYTSYQSSAPVKLLAGQTLEAGWINFSAVVDGYVTITIELNEGWRLKTVEDVIVKDAVKVQGYTSTPPAANPAPGLFTTYKDNKLEFKVPYFKFYGIHLDVEWEKCEEME